MISIYQGETLTFTLGENDLNGYEVRASLFPAGTTFSRDCTCGNAALTWDKIDVVDGVAFWSLTTEQSKELPVGKYAIEVALRDIETQQDIKDATNTTVIEVKQSYTR